MTLGSAAGRIPLKLVIFTSALLIASLIAASALHLKAFERELEPELDRKAAAVASTLTQQLARAVEAGIPLERLRGIRPFLAEIVADHPEIRYVSLTDSAGNTVFESGFGPGMTAGGPPPQTLEALSLTRHPVTPGGDRAATVVMGVDPAFAAEKLADIGYDVLVTFLVSLFLTFEILLVVVALSVSEPMRRVRTVIERGKEGDFSGEIVGGGSDEMGRFVRAFNAYLRFLHERQHGLAHHVAGIARGGVEDRGDTEPAATPARGVSAIRMPLFLFFFATELSRPFLPLYARQLYDPLPWLSQEMAIALPFTGYLFLVAVLTPWAGVWSARIGPRRLFLWGLVPAFIGFLGSGVADSLWELLLWRCINALGFAMTTIAALGYIAEVSTAKTRAKGMVTYTAAFVTAGVCGTAIGGILADRIGYAPTFFLAAALAVISAAMLLASLPRQPRRADTGVRLTRRDFAQVLGNRGFLVLILLAAIPTQVITTGYLFFATPLLLDGAGYDASVIGRVMMVYFVVMILLGHPLARLADRLGRHLWFAAAGLLLAGLAAALLGQAEQPWFQGHDAWWVALSVGLVGVGHALCIPSQGAILLGISERTHGDPRRATAAISVYRLLERVGSVAGPFLAAALFGLMSHHQAVAVIGLYVLVSGLLFLFFHPPAPTEGHAEETPL